MLGSKECAILGVISEGSIHGYELMNLLENRGYEQWTEISLPSVYRIINALVKDGLIVGRLEGKTRGAPKKLYSLTAKGRKLLTSSLLEHLTHPVRSRSSFDLGIAHIGLLDGNDVREAVESRLQSLREQNSIMRRRRGDQKNQPWNVEALFIHGEQRYKAETYYLNFLLKHLQEKPPADSI